MIQPVFTAMALTKTYGSGEVQVHALNNVALTITEKEVVVLLGPSGSGKLFFRNLELTGLNDRELTNYRRRHVGFVFQFCNLVPSLTAYGNVALVTEIAARPMRPDEALSLVGLEARMHNFHAQLSGGEQQRIAIARDRQAPDCAAMRRADRRAGFEAGLRVILLCHPTDASEKFMLDPRSEYRNISLASANTSEHFRKAFYRAAACGSSEPSITPCKLMLTRASQIGLR
jgi:hypothetical protein